MVSYNQILASNAAISDATVPTVSVFVGGTSGIGQLTIKALVKTGASQKIYLVGRKSSAERMQLFIKELNDLNPKAKIIWTEAEISLLAEVKRVCEHIRSLEARVDLLFLTAGYAPFGKRVETSEGIETAQSLEYYSRMLFIKHLIPLLNHAESPRVISVLSGGMESASIDLEDIDLRRPGNFGGMKAQKQYGTLNSITMEKFSNDNPNVTFIHSWPGSVDTGNVKRGRDPNTFWDWFAWLVVEPLIKLLTFTDDESGQRHLFQCTSAFYGGHGITWDGERGINTAGEKANGMFLVSYKCECSQNAKVMSVLREKARDKVWDHTMEVFEPYM